MYKLRYSARSRKDIKRLDWRIKRRLEQALYYIAKDPGRGKALVGNYKGKFSFRTGDYRIIYQVERKRREILVVAIGHRRGIYR
jgi:mRNA interferase RelE/StbE